MECGQIRELLTAYLEGEVPPERARLVEDHLSSCRECNAAMEDLKKTIALLEGLEEVEPPPWLTQKIMAHVREEAEERSGILRRFFYPLRIKVPLEVFATLLVVGLAAYLYTTTTPQFEPARVSGEAQVFRQGAPPARTPEDASSVAGQRRETSLEAGPSKKAETIQGVPREASRPELSAQASTEQRETIRAEKSAEETEKVGVLRGQADYAGKAGESFRASPPETSAFLPGASLSAPPRQEFSTTRSTALPPEPALRSTRVSGPERLNLTVRVTDVDAAAQQVEKLLVDAGAQQVTRSPGEGAESVSAELKGDEVKSFVQKLNGIGATGGAQPGVQDRATVAVTVGIVGMDKADEVK